MTDFNINVIVNPQPALSGTKKVDRQLQKLEKRGRSLNQVLRNSFAFIGVAAVVREIGRLVDSFTNAQNRIRLVTRDTVQLNAVTQQLFEISRRTRVGFEATVSIFTRTALATKNLGLTQRETLEFTESLNQAVIISGASAQEANAGLIQLSQGLASGTLRGDELRSVLEQLPKVADVIAKQMNVTRGELRLLGQEGKISADIVIDAFASAAEDLQRDFAGMTVTIGQAFLILRSNLIQFISQVNESIGLSRKFAEAIVFLGDNLDNLAKIAIIVGSAILTGFVKRGLLAAIAAVRTLTLAIAANPLGALAIAAVAVVTALVQFSDQISITNSGVATLADIIDVAFTSASEAIDTALASLFKLADFIPEVFQPILDFLSPIGDAFTTTFGDLEVSIGGVLRFTTRILDGFIGLWSGAFNAIVNVFSKLPEALGKFFIDAINAAIKPIETLINTVIDAINFVNKLSGLGELAGLGEIETISFSLLENQFKTGFSDLGEIASNSFVASYTTTFEDATNKFLEDVETKARQRLAAIKSIPDAGLDVRPEPEDRIPFAIREQLRLLDEEAKTLKLTNKERDIQNKLLAIERKLRTANTSIEGFRALIEARLRNNQALKEEASILDSIIQPQQALVDRQRALNALYDRGAISVSQLQEEMFQLNLTQAELNVSVGQGTFADGFILGISDMLESVRNFGSEAGAIFGDFFTQASEGFGKAIGDAIVFGDSLRESIGNVARQALASLIGGLVKLGIQFVLNATLGTALASTATAAGIAQAAAISSAFATPAALVSLASFGANSVPASAGIASTVAISQGLALALADGGFVSGAGGSRSDSIPAMLSNGEFVVNAKSTARFRPQLESMNNPSGFQAGGLVGNAGAANSAVSSAESDSQRGGGTKIINVLDPNLMEDFVASPQGERVIVNLIERNSSSITQILGNT